MPQGLMVVGSKIICGPIEAALANGMLVHADDVIAKARDLRALVLGPATTNQLVEAVFELEKRANIRELRPLLEA
jgi:hypothetical protein